MPSLKTKLAALVALMAICSPTLTVSLLTLLPAPPTLAQTNDARKAEADRLLQQGAEQVFNVFKNEQQQCTQQECKDEQWKTALPLLQQALSLYKSIGDRHGEGKALLAIGVAYYGLKDDAKATVPLQQALTISKEVKDSKLESLAARFWKSIEATRLIEQAGKKSTSEFRESLKLLEQALSLFREISAKEKEGATLIYIGTMYGMLGNAENAIKHYEQAILIAKEIRNSEIESTASSLLKQFQDPNYLKIIEANRLSQQGTDQLQAKQFTAAIQSWQ